MVKVAIVSVCRTPLTKRVKKGKSRVSSQLLISTAVEEALLRTPHISKCMPEDVAVGNVLGGASASVTARTAIVSAFKKASLPPLTPIRLVNRQCASGLQVSTDKIAKFVHLSLSLSLSPSI